ncbi:MAG: DUF3592 domain-containing protein [Planctomycetota bacterium]
MRLLTRRNRGQVFGKLVGSGLGLVLGIGAICFGIWHHHRVSAAEKWPVVQGVVDDAKIVTSRGRRGKTSYRCEVKYHFSVNGTHFAGDKLDPTGNQNESSSAAHDHLLEYPRGGPCTVHYDPADPAVNCLEMGTTTVGWIFVLVGMVMVLACGFSFARVFMGLGRL